MEKQELERLLTVGSLLRSDAQHVFAFVSQHREQLETIDITLGGASMSPAIPKGSRIRIRLNYKGMYEPGQVVAFLYKGRIMVHRIRYCGRRGKAKHYLLTQGDAMVLPDDPVHIGSLLGPVIAFQNEEDWIAPGDLHGLSSVRNLLSSFCRRCITGILEINVSAGTLLAKCLRSSGRAFGP
jgi:hypothetical protein